MDDIHTGQKPTQEDVRQGLTGRLEVGRQVRGTERRNSRLSHSVMYWRAETLEEWVDRLLLGQVWYFEEHVSYFLRVGVRG